MKMSKLHHRGLTVTGALLAATVGLASLVMPAYATVPVVEDEPEITVEEAQSQDFLSDVEGEDTSDGTDEWVDLETYFETDAGGDPYVDQEEHFAELPFEAVSRAVAAAGFDMQRAKANWTPGYILSDRAMYTPSLMSEAEIKTFIEAKGANCTSTAGATCLKDKTAAPLSLKSKFDGSGYGCKPLALAGGTKPWAAIKAVGDACGINPQVLLVFIQKESSGLTQALIPSRWDKMMGMGCPDGKPCDTQYAGFTNQLYYSADALTSYRYRGFKFNVAADTGQPIAVNNSSAVEWRDKCGTQTFVMQNQATASLYTYNPAVPTARAVAAYPSYTGDPCDSWGQLNVYMFMLQWFPLTMQDHPAATPQDFTGLPKPTVGGLPFVGSMATVIGGAGANFTPAAAIVTYQWLRDGEPIAGATGSSYRVSAADLNKKLSVRVTGSRQYFNSATVTSNAVTPKGTTVRLSGANRYETNLAVNQQQMVAGKPLFVATGSDFADALSVGPAVSALGGSLVLSTRDQLPASTLNLIKSKKPSAVYVIGGTGALSDKVLASLQSATGVSPTRIGGADRYETSANILTTFYKDRAVPKVFLATGADYPDALSAAAAGGALSMPVLLIEGGSGSIAPAATSFLKSKGTKNLVVVGGEGVIREAAATSVKSAVGATSLERLSGLNRYATNQAVNGFVTANGSVTEGIWVATGKDFPDALSAAVPAGAKTQRLVLSPGTCIPKPVVSSWINASTSKVNRMSLVGGTGVLTGSVQDGVECG